MVNYDLLNGIPLPVRLLEQMDDDTPVYRYLNEAAKADPVWSLTEVLGSSAEQLFPNPWGRAETLRHREVFRSGNPLTYIHDVLLPAGPKTVQTTFVPSVQTQKSAPCVIATTVDITNNDRNDTIWLKSEAINQQIRQFTALATNDLRAPMRRINMFADLLRQNFKDHGDGKLEMISTISDISDKVVDQISSLLDHTAKIDSSIQGVETFDLTQLCSELLEHFDPMQTHNLTVQPVSITAEVGTVRFIMRSLLRKALSNSGVNLIDVSIAVESNPMLGEQIMYTFIVNSNEIENLHAFCAASSHEGHVASFMIPTIKSLLESRGGSLTSKLSDKNQGVIVQFCLPGVIR